MTDSQCEHSEDPKKAPQHLLLKELTLTGAVSSGNHKGAEGRVILSLPDKKTIQQARARLIEVDPDSLQRAKEDIARMLAEMLIEQDRQEADGEA